MPYIYSLPTAVSFTGKGLLGYSFGPLQQKDLEVYYIEVKKGHDFYMISKSITRTYYVLSGNGYFTINDHKYDVSRGMIIEVPPKLEYCYSGTMTLLGLSKPRWFQGNDTFTRWNPDVVPGLAIPFESTSALLRRLALWKLFGKSPITAFLRLNQRLWTRLPLSVTTLTPVRSYGDFLHKLARIRGDRAQAFSTLFLRNRPALELLRRVAVRLPKGDSLRVAVLGCSTGAEAYSISWRILSERPDLKLVIQAVDISPQAIEVAKKGEYSLTSAQLTNTQILENVTPAESEQIFQKERDVMRVRSWIKDGISWSVADAGDPQAVDSFAPQDIVIANNFLCHMEPPEAEQCLRNIARMLRPDGYVFVAGIDLDVRTKVACDLGWLPVEELLEEIHEGDRYMRSYWPVQYAGLEPLNKKRRDWKVRYAAVFRVPPEASVAKPEQESALCNV